jgi:glycosyltransferase involved in cell wall biosynthesis
MPADQVSLDSDMTALSIITVCYNSAKTISRTLESVGAQSFKSIEHIIVDGGSTDGTLEVVNGADGAVCKVVSESDDGIYDAMNKGVRLAKGEIVAFLNSDDVYTDTNVARDVVGAFHDRSVGLVYGDIDMVDQQGRLVRRWITGGIEPRGKVVKQIPHPAMFVRRSALDLLSVPFDPTYRIAADLKQQLMLLNVQHVGVRYLGRPLATMLIGGRSTASLGSYVEGWRESARAYNDVFGRLGWWYTICKVASKIKGIRRLG